MFPKGLWKPLFVNDRYIKFDFCLQQVDTLVERIILYIIYESCG